MLVRQLEQQLAGRASEEEAELRRRQEEARQGAGGGRSAQEGLQAGVVELEVAGLKRANKVLRQQSILRRLVHASMQEAYGATRDARDSMAAQLAEAVEAREVRDDEIAQLRSRVAELEAGGGGGGGGAFDDARAMVRGAGGGGSARFAGVARKPMAGSPRGAPPAYGSGSGAEAAPLSEEAARFESFHALATERKLALASRGFEVYMHAYIYIYMCV